MRGKLHNHPQRQNRSGITPAGAGKTRVVGDIGEHCEDHPRRCGENLFILVLVALPLGSPPQVRGKQDAMQGIFKWLGITPAGAGKTGKMQ